MQNKNIPDNLEEVINCYSNAIRNRNISSTGMNIKSLGKLRSAALIHEKKVPGAGAVVY